MGLSLVWLLVMYAASWSGWLLAGRTEVATMFLGAGIALLSGLEWLSIDSRQRLRIMPACGIVAGVGILCAGAFDRLDINRFDASGDWLTGFAVGAGIAAVFLARPVRRNALRGDGFALGDLPGPHWDAIWISLGFALWQWVDVRLDGHFDGQGHSTPQWSQIVACSLVWLLVAAIVQKSRFGRLHTPRLILAAASPAIFMLCETLHLGWLSNVLALLVFWAMCCAGGSYPLRWPSGTFADGFVQLRGWLLTALTVLFITPNLSASLMNTTVTAIIAAQEFLAPVSEASFMRIVMEDAYLWFDERASLRDETNNSRPSLKGMRVAERDRFSVAWRIDSRRPERKGNPGVFISRQDGATYVAHVIAGSPADKAGIARGWRLLPADPGSSDQEKRIYAFAGPGNTRRDVAATTTGSEPFVDFRISADSGRRIGYLYLNRFEPGAQDDLDKAFAEFHKAGIDELVIDLRYNPGGAVFMMRHLASLVAGNQHPGEALYRISHNTKYTDADEVGRFKRMPNGLDLARAFVLTSRHSCSASELLIVGLRAYLPVVTIGEVTCGKPLGSTGVRFGNQFFRVLSFRASDVRGQGYYNEGLIPDCIHADDLGKRFKLGTSEDPMFSVAQNYMNSGRCERGTSASQTPPLTASTVHAMRAP